MRLTQRQRLVYLYLAETSRRVLCRLAPPRALAIGMPGVTPRRLIVAPTDLRAQVNLANLARDAGEHAEARCLYTDLLRQLPDHPVIRPAHPVFFLLTRSSLSWKPRCSTISA